MDKTFNISEASKIISFMEKERSLKPIMWYLGSSIKEKLDKENYNGVKVLVSAIHIRENLTNKCKWVDKEFYKSHLVHIRESLNIIKNTEKANISTKIEKYLEEIMQTDSKKEKES